jgi:hypothetical protein
MTLSFLRTNWKRKDPPTETCMLLFKLKMFAFEMINCFFVEKRFELLKDKALTESSKSIDLISKIAGL